MSVSVLLGHCVYIIHWCFFLPAVVLFIHSFIIQNSKRHKGELDERPNTFGPTCTHKARQSHAGDRADQFHSGTVVNVAVPDCKLFWLSFIVIHWKEIVHLSFCGAVTCWVTILHCGQVCVCVFGGFLIYIFTLHCLPPIQKTKTKYPQKTHLQLQLLSGQVRKCPPHFLQLTLGTKPLKSHAVVLTVETKMFMPAAIHECLIAAVCIQRAPDQRLPTLPLLTFFVVVSTQTAVAKAKCFRRCKEFHVRITFSCSNLCDMTKLHYWNLRSQECSC